MIHLVPLWRVDDVWPSVAPGMEKAIRRTYSDRSVGQLFMDCRCGAKLLYVFANEDRAEAAMIVDVVGDLMRVIAFARIEGAPLRLKAWMEEFVTHDWSSLGVKRMRTDGRFGWEKVVPGIRVIRHVYELEFGT